MINKKLFIGILVILLITSIGFSQSNKFGRGKGRVKGSVKDVEGNPLPNVSVLLTHEDRVTTFKSITNKKGVWQVIGLGTGEFIIDVKLDGYIPYNTLRPINQFGRNPSVNCVLKKTSAAGEPFVQEDLKPKLEEAEKLMAEKKYDEALAIYKYVLEKAPKVYQMLFKIADCTRAKGDVDVAIISYDKGIKMAIENKDIASAAQALGIIGDIYLKKKDLKTAGEYFEKSIELNPKDEILAYNVGEINFNNMKTDEAIKYFKMAISIKPTWGPPYKQMGYAYLNKGDMKKSLEMFNKFIMVDPDSKDAAIIKQVIKSLPK